MQQRIFFQTAHLSLTNADFIGHFHLRFTHKKAQIDNFLLALVQASQSVGNAKLLRPTLLALSHVGHLVKHVNRVAAIVENRLKQGNRFGNSVQRKNHLRSRQ